MSESVRTCGTRRKLTTIVRHVTSQCSEPSFPSPPSPSPAASAGSTAQTGSGGLIQTSAEGSAAGDFLRNVVLCGHMLHLRFQYRK